MNSQGIYINKYLPVAVLYFFINGFLLPQGLLYTTLLTPVFIWWIIKNNAGNKLLTFFWVTVPFAIIHFYNGVEVGYYLRSYILLFSVYVFCVAFYEFLKNTTTLKEILKDILVLNGIMVIVALVAFFVPAIQLVFWYDNAMSLGNIEFRRLKMLTYEPSYYSTLFAPIAIYYLIRIARKDIPQKWLYLTLVLAPLLLSLSFGVILGIAIALSVLVLINFRKTLLNKTTFPYVVGTIILLAVALLGFIIFFPENVFLVRIQNTLMGKDTSFNGRTIDSFILALRISEQKSIIWGVGPGQVKLLGLEVFKEYYNYSRFTINDIGIPNNLGDFLATFGIVGFAMKLLAEVYLYFKTRVYTNYYRQALFLFIFIYQFTGSYIMNIAEYVIWIMAFKVNLFNEFDKIPAHINQDLKKY